MQRLLFPLALCIALGLAAFANYQLTSVPMIRPQIQRPLYVLAEAGAANKLADGQQVLALGPWCFGLFTGQQAFSSIRQARDFVGLKGLDSRSQHLYQTSGDYQFDTTDGVLNKTLALVKPIPWEAE